MLPVMSITAVVDAATVINIGLTITTDGTPSLSDPETSTEVC